MEPPPRRTIDVGHQRAANRPAQLSLRQRRHNFPYLSIVLTGRNDEDNGDFHEQLIAATSFNHRLLAACGVDYELVFVEWRPVPGRELVSDLLRREVPEVAARLITYEVDERYHAALSQNPQLQFLEFVAKNVGIRRAAGSYILVTNSDIYFSSDVVNLIARRMLRPMVVYRATRVNLRSHLDPTDVSESVLTDPRNHDLVDVLQPPFLTSACGDFLLLDRFSFCALRGFNEVFRAARIHDSNFCYHAAAEGMAIVNTGMYIYHFGEGTSVAPPVADSREQSAGALWNRTLYENPPSWGLGDSPLNRRGPGHVRLEYDPDALPPLVALQRIKSPLFAPCQLQSLAGAGPRTRSSSE